MDAYSGDATFHDACFCGVHTERIGLGKGRGVGARNLGRNKRCFIKKKTVAQNGNGTAVFCFSKKQRAQLLAALGGTETFGKQGKVCDQRVRLALGIVLAHGNEEDLLS